METQHECEKLGATKVIITVGDLREASVAKELIDHTIQEFGQIDSLINAAGILVNGTVLEANVRDLKKSESLFKLHCFR